MTAAVAAGIDLGPLEEPTLARTDHDGTVHTPDCAAATDVAAWPVPRWAALLTTAHCPCREQPWPDPAVAPFTAVAGILDCTFNPHPPTLITLTATLQKALFASNDTPQAAGLVAALRPHAVARARPLAAAAAQQVVPDPAAPRTAALVRGGANLMSLAVHGDADVLVVHRPPRIDHVVIVVVGHPGRGAGPTDHVGVEVPDHFTLDHVRLAAELWVRSEGGSWAALCAAALTIR